jgi:hypothetical protein
MRLAVAGVTAGALLAAAAPARAELVFFANGRTMSVRAHRVEGDRLILELRTGGQIECDPSAIMEIAPDEVPYPELTPTVPESVTLAAPDFDPHAYDPIINRFAKEQGVPTKLVHAVIQVESAYHERARSPRGAMGLMQLMPETARQYAVANPYDPAANIEAGTKHLKFLLTRFPLTLALAAYNSGEAAVERFRGIPPYPETRTYVRRVLQLVGQ